MFLRTKYWRLKFGKGRFCGSDFEQVLVPLSAVKVEIESKFDSFLTTLLAPLLASFIINQFWNSRTFFLLTCRQKQQEFQNWLMIKLVPSFKLKTNYLYHLAPPIPRKNVLIFFEGIAQGLHTTYFSSGGNVLAHNLQRSVSSYIYTLYCNTQARIGKSFLSSQRINIKPGQNL